MSGGWWSVWLPMEQAPTWGEIVCVDTNLITKHHPGVLCCSRLQCSAELRNHFLSDRCIRYWHISSASFLLPMESTASMMALNVALEPHLVFHLWRQHIVINGRYIYYTHVHCICSICRGGTTGSPGSSLPAGLGWLALGGEGVSVMGSAWPCIPSRWPAGLSCNTSKCGSTCIHAGGGLWFHS